MRVPQPLSAVGFGVSGSFQRMGEQILSKLLLHGEVKNRLAKKSVRRPESRCGSV